MQGASSLDAAIQLDKYYNAMFSKQQRNPDPQHAGQKSKVHNPGFNGQNKSAQHRKPRLSGCTGASTNANN